MDNEYSEEAIKHKEQLEKEDISKYPSLFQQARNVIKQGWLSGTGLIYGRGFLADPEKVAKRLEICETCEFFNKESSRCYQCGCFMMSKAQLEMSGCPANKWGDLTTVKSGKTREQILKDGETLRLRKATQLSDATKNMPMGFTLEERVQFDKLVKEAHASNNKSFVFKNMQYTIVIKPDGRHFISGSSVI